MYTMYHLSGTLGADSLSPQRPSTLQHRRLDAQEEAFHLIHHRNNHLRVMSLFPSSLGSLAVALLCRRVRQINDGEKYTTPLQWFLLTQVRRARHFTPPIHAYSMLLRLVGLAITAPWSKVVQHGVSIHAAFMVYVELSNACPKKAV